MAVVKTGPPRFPLLSIVFHPWILSSPFLPSLFFSPSLPFRHRLSLPVYFIDRSFESLRPISPMRHVIENKTGFRLYYYLCVANRWCVETLMHRPTQPSPLELKKSSSISSGYIIVVPNYLIYIFFSDRSRSRNSIPKLISFFVGFRTRDRVLDFHSDETDRSTFPVPS